MNYNTILPPFKWFILENFPYIEDDFDALTNWQLFCKLGKEMNKIIKKCNLTGKQVEQLTNAFNLLKDYIDNYFDNLDVQSEIDNKLDEMAESGQLVDIIAQYLELGALLCFNTKSEMKLAENLVNGSIARTLGDTTYNDGFGYLYKIRELLNTDVIDDLNLIALYNDNLVAERIHSNTIGDKTNPCYYGADPTGTVDSADAINNCILANKGRAVKFTPGKYLVNSSINTPYYTDEQVNIDFAGSTLYTEEELDYVLGIGTVEHSTDMPNRGDYSDKTCYAIFENFVIDAPNSNIGIYTEYKYWYPRIINGSIFNTIIGIQSGTIDNVEDTWSSDLFVDNVLIQCKDYKDTDTKGIILYGHDNKITNCRIYNAFIGIDNRRDGNYFINDHIYLYGHLNEKTTPEFIQIYPQTIAFRESGDHNNFINMYTDSYSTHYKFYKTNYNGRFIGCTTFTNVGGYDDIGFDFTNGTIETLTITDSYINLGSPSTNGNIGLKLGPSQRFDILCQCLNLTNNRTAWINKDLIMIDTNKNNVYPYNGDTSVTTGKYYIMGYIPISNDRDFTVEITGIRNTTKHQARFGVDGNGYLTVTNQGDEGSYWGIGGKIVTIRGAKYLEISVMQSHNGQIRTGIDYKKVYDGLGIGIIPLYERQSIRGTTSPVETTPSVSTTFDL